MRGTTVITLLVSLLVAGCASAPDRELSRQDTPYASLVTAKDPLNPSRFVVRGGQSAAADIVRYYEAQRGHALNILLMSGGGQNGAFGAGVLKGWREAGTRPEFDIVTGVSTGALLATHAFLGTPADDAVLEKLFTGITADDIYSKRSLGGLLGGAPSLLDTDPLEALIAENITSEVLERVAAEHAKGRRLLVGATNLDYAQTWAWNLGEIASTGGPDALELYRKVLKASSAFPVMFPPVEIDGHLFADGAVRANVLVVGLSGAEPPGPPLHGRGTIWVIENGRATQTPSPVKRSLVSIAGATIGEMMGSSTYGLLIRAYFSAQVHDYHYQSVAVPEDTDIGSDPLAFDPAQMQAGFDAGVRLGMQPDPWSDQPPLIGDFPEWAIEAIKKNM